MRATLLATLPLAFTLASAPAAAQVNWDADASLCDAGPTCAILHAEVRGQRFTAWLQNGAAPLVAFNWVISGLFQPGPYAVDLGGADEDGWMIPGPSGNAFGGQTYGYYDGTGDYGAITGDAIFRLWLQEPIRVADASLRASVTSAHAIDYRDNTDCGPGGQYEGDVGICPPFEFITDGPIDATIAQVTPEPAPLALLATGLLALVGLGAGRRTRAHA